MQWRNNNQIGGQYWRHGLANVREGAPHTPLHAHTPHTPLPSCVRVRCTVRLWRLRKITGSDILVGSSRNNAAGLDVGSALATYHSAVDLNGVSAAARVLAVVLKRQRSAVDAYLRRCAASHLRACIFSLTNITCRMTCLTINAYVGDVTTMA